MKVTADAGAACEALREAATLMREDPNRTGSLLRFGTAGQLVVTGDLHGHVRNLEKLQRFCALERSPARYVMLQELIHSQPNGLSEPDLSIDVLVRAAEWKCRFPDNVFSIQSNHELSQWQRHEITKGGRSVLDDFRRGVEARFGGGAERVLFAVDDYIAALPLAAQTEKGGFISHSLPDALAMDSWDPSVLKRVPTPAELAPGGAAYALVWGRFQSPEAVRYFAQRLGVSYFIVGHMPQESGYAVVGQMIVLASDHNHGVFLPLVLSREYTVAELEQNIRKFVAVP